MSLVSIIDYGSGNLRSVAKACEHVVADASLSREIRVTANPKDIAAASHIILPGVGAFGDCVQGLSALPGMVEALKEAALVQKRPFLGICVGMQMLADTGYEHGTHQGLGWIGGEVVPIKPQNASYKIPHMGWNTLGNVKQDHPVLQGIEEGSHAYFVHAYHFRVKDKRDIHATVDYGAPLVAILARENLVATQFHPEKSQKTGLRLLENFLGK